MLWSASHLTLAGFNVPTQRIRERMSEEAEPVRSSITEAPILFSSFEICCQRHFWLLEGTRVL